MGRPKKVADTAGEVKEPVSTHFKESLTVVTYDSEKQVWGEKNFCTDKEKAAWLREIIKLPGEYKFDKRIKLVTEQADYFDEYGVYTEVVEGTYDYIEYWENQKRLCKQGILIDEEYYIPGDHYWYLNFLKIPVKDDRGLAFPRFQDLDVWTFQCIELAILENKYMTVLKARQTGFSLKFLAMMLKRVWFEKAYTGKYAAYADIYLESAWKVILMPYRNHLNEYTGWPREFHPSDVTYNWKQGYKVIEGGRTIYKGNLSSLRAYTTQQKASTVVSGKTDELLYDEAGVSMNVGKVMQMIIPALRDGNRQTGRLWVIGAAGEVKESESLQKIFYQPEAYNGLSFPNIWSNRPEEKIGMFVPYYYSFGDCMDEWGNSDIPAAKKAHAEMAELEKRKSYNEFAIFMAQYPGTPEDAFSTQEENIFPVAKIQPHYERLKREYKETVVTLVEDRTKPTGITHKFGSQTPVITDFPIRANTDRRGALVVDEFPEENPPFGLYYVTVDPIRAVRTDTSESLQSVYVYKSAHRIDGEYTEDKAVAWYTGRHDNAYDTYEMTKKIILRWNARTAIESDQASCIEWMLKERMQRYLMKRSDIPILKDWVPTSQIHQEYGWRTGSGNSTVKEHLCSLVIEYCNEVIATEFDENGEPREVYGVSRIKDIMLLKELLSYNPRKGNYDRIIAFAAALMVARANTNRGLMVIKKAAPTTPPPQLTKGLTQNYRALSSSFGRTQKKPKTAFQQKYQLR